MSDFNNQVTWPRGLEDKIVAEVDFSTEEVTVPNGLTRMLRTIETCKCGRFDLEVCGGGGCNGK